MPRYSNAANLPLNIVPHAGASLPAQIAEQVRDLIVAGTLAPGDPLPSTRALATELGVSRGTVVAAFEQLSAEGYLAPTKGGTRVTENLKLQKMPGRTSGQAQRADRMEHPRPEAINMQPGHPDTSLLTSAVWRAAWRTAAASPGTQHPPQGSARLQEQLAEHLRIMRHVVREPQQVLITAGARDGFRLVLTALRQQRRNRPLRVAVENPGYPSLHRIPATFGHEILPIAVDDNGLNPARLPQRQAPDVVLVAPSHQYPLGASMPVARRLELIEWARANDAYIVEDDYDSELRYTGEPLPALAALDDAATGRVITLGSFTKTLTPGLGLGYLLAPDATREALVDLRRDLGTPVSSIVQDAMADFLADGGARRHIARMRRVYGRRREALLHMLEHVPQWVQVLPMDGGLHLVLRFTCEQSTPQVEAQIVERLAQRGVAVARLGEYWSGPVSAPERPVHTPPGRERNRAQQNPTDPHERRDIGLIVGFGGVSEHVLARGAEALTSVLGDYS
ncbi:PLP-dependent aminotransferase family protein [Rothia sp. LK2588]|uniref:MocR-like pyridoxine biosynthesis transcription factor PdxR n=1 Tax=Rothia sp. LK2588 TaxID=3114369 RepID=UPI0034CD3360